MRKYRITLPAVTLVIKAKNKQEARDAFWDKFDKKGGLDDKKLKLVQIYKKTYAKTKRH